MTMKVTFHDGELTRWSVRLKPLTKRVQRALAEHPDPDVPRDYYPVSVFIGGHNIEDAKQEAIEKAEDNWMRHRGWKTRWIVIDARED
jgi:hypothetical protein